VSRREIVDWLKAKLRELTELKVVEKLCQVSNIHYKAHTWTSLKLLALAYWVSIYTKIISKRYSNYWYLDLLAGPGTDLISETGDVIVGSPFIAHFFAQRPFSRYIFIELDGSRFRALKARVEALGIRASVYPADCNDVVRALKLNADHMLIFVDCEGLEVHWNTIDRLLQRPSDLLLLFQTQELNRSLGRGKQGLGDEKRLTSFMGDESWREAEGAEEFLAMYMEKLRGYRKYVEGIKIRGRLQYDLVLACKPGPYTRAWVYLKNRLERVADKDVELVLRLLRGEVKVLDEFFPAQKRMDEYLDPDLLYQ